LHAPQDPHADTFILPPIRDDEHAHADSSLEESSDSEDSNDSDSESVQSDAEPEQRPKWAHTTLQVARDIFGDRGDTRRTRSDFEEPPIALTTTKPFPSRHILLVKSSDPQSYGEAPRNLFWESAMQEEYKSLLENQTWDLVPFLLGGNLSDADGSIGPRVQ
jgi:hypothetical protein